jgi:hypothetical protein
MTPTGEDLVGVFFSLRLPPHRIHFKHRSSGFPEESACGTVARGRLLSSNPSLLLDLKLRDLQNRIGAENGIPQKGERSCRQEFFSWPPV